MIILMTSLVPSRIWWTRKSRKNCCTWVQKTGKGVVACGVRTKGQTTAPYQEAGADYNVNS